MDVLNLGAPESLVLAVLIERGQIETELRGNAVAEGGRCIVGHLVLLVDVPDVLILKQLVLLLRCDA